MAQRPLSAERRQSLLGTALIGLCCLGTGVALAAGRAWLVRLAPPLTPNSSAAELSRNRRRSLDPDRRRDAALLLSAQAGSTPEQRRAWLRGQGWGNHASSRVLAAISLKRAALAAQASGRPQEAQALWRELLRRFPKEPASADALYALGRQQPPLRRTLLERFAAHPAALAAALEAGDALHLARWGARWPGAEALLLQTCDAQPATLRADEQQLLASGLVQLGRSEQALSCLGETTPTAELQLRLAQGLLRGSRAQQTQAEARLLRLAQGGGPEGLEAARILAQSPAAGAVAVLQQLPPSLQDSAPVQARLAEAGQIDPASVLERWPNDPASWELQWREARKALLQRDWVQAQRWMDQLNSATLPAPLAARQLFWRGWTAQQQGDQASAEQFWRATQRTQPLGYYSWRASERLGDKRNDDAKGETHQAWQPLNSGDARIDALWQRGQALEAWESWRSKQGGQPPSSPEEFLIEGRLRTAIGDDWTGLGQLERASFRLPQIGCRGQLERERQLHPLRFSKELTAASEDSGVDLALLLAVAKQESRFSPSVRSGAGASGLLQLMPATASELAGESLDHQALSDPGRNGALGAAYLKQLLSGAGGNLFQAIASYNAGPGAVGGWLTRGGFDLQREPELWTEAIPYPETRLYTKKVLGNAWSYRQQGRSAEELCR
ncbi:MAG: lytic transglycosylase domain-containing protein [Synechococcus sp. WH 8007]|nr:lytic transglycosylase domain-containing protein [Synechococcus sp. WH 8007]